MNLKEDVHSNPIILSPDSDFSSDSDSELCLKKSASKLKKNEFIPVFFTFLDHCAILKC